MSRTTDAIDGLRREIYDLRQAQTPKEPGVVVWTAHYGSTPVAAATRFDVHDGFLYVYDEFGSALGVFRDWIGAWR